MITTHGGTHIFLDEIHKYKQWQDCIKNIYDDYPDLHIVYTGSSILKLKSGDGDLSRRVRSYEMSGLSFREYLMFEGAMHYHETSLEDIRFRPCNRTSGFSVYLFLAWLLRAANIEIILLPLQGKINCTAI